MKRKPIAIALVIVVAITAIGGATLAYFKSTATAKNTFVVGNVKITLDEFGKNEEAAIVPADEALDHLVPGTEETTLVSDIATVTNTGKNDAYVWAEILVPKALTSAKKDTAGNALHFVTYDAFATESYGKTDLSVPEADGIMDGSNVAIDESCDYVTLDTENGDFTWSAPVKTEERTVEGKTYTVYLTKMQGILKSGMTTLPFLRGVYMDYRVNYLRTEEDGSDVYKIPSEAANGKVSFVEYGGEWDIVLNAYAIQSDGLADFDTAYAAYIKEAGV